MLRALPLFCSILLMQGCGESVVVDKSSKPATEDSVSHFSLSSISLEDEDVLRIDGRVVRYDLLRNQRGVFDRYIIESPLEQMGLEGAVFWELARKGYVRKVRMDEAERYVTNYILKGRATLTADYRTWNDNGAKSRLVLTRRILEQ